MTGTNFLVSLKLLTADWRILFESRTNFSKSELLKTILGKHVPLKGIRMQWRRRMKGKAASIIAVACLVGLGYLAGAQTVKADDPPSPVEVPQGWQRLGPYGGKVVDVAYAPSDPNIVYALLDNETVPVYKSTDNGKTWNFLSVPFEPLQSQTIAVSPVNPNIVLFCDARNVFKSIDGGLTWTKSETIYARKIKFSLADPNKVYASGFSYLYKSSDIGEHWTAISNDTVRFCALDPHDANRILVPQLGDNPNDTPGLYQTLDDGVTWELFGFEGEYIDIIAFGRSPGRIYFVKRSDTVIWKSTDNGETWSTLSEIFPGDIIDMELRGNLTDEFTIIVSDSGEAFYSNIWRSTDDGATWQNVPSQWVHVLYDHARVDPSNNSRIIGFNYWLGMHFTWDSGDNWTMSGSVFPGIPIQRVGISPVIEGLILVQARSGYDLRSSDSGKTWEFTSEKIDDSGGYGFSFSQSDGNLVFRIAADKVLKSVNAGMDWEDKTPPVYPCLPCSIAVCPNNDSIVLTGNHRGVIFRSSDTGENWTEVYNASDTSVYIRFIRFKPLDPTVVYAGTISNTSVVKLLKSTDSGATWVEVSRLPTIYLNDLTVTCTEPEILFESDGSRLLRSVNQGVDWELVRQDINLQSDKCLVSARNPNWVWATGSSFALSTDLGQNWVFSSRFAVYDDAAVDYNSNSVMGPNWLPYLIFPSQVDGIWTRVEDMPPRIMMAGSNYDTSASMLHFNAWVSDVKGPEDIVTVEILFEGNELGVRLYDDGTHGDLNAHDGLFSLSIPAEVNDPIINVPYSLIAKDKNGLVSRGWPELNATNFRGER